MTKQKLLICGPWIGEFSYEVHSWAPKLRYYINNHYSDYKVIHIGFPGRQILYKDFVDEYISYPKSLTDQLPPSNSGGIGRGSEHTLYYPLIEEYLEQYIKDNKQKYEDIFILRPEELQCITKSQVIKDYDDVEFVNLIPDEIVDKDVKNFMSSFSEGDTISIMANAPHETKKYRENWDPKSWEWLIEKLIVELNLNVVMMGIKSEDNLQGSYTFEGTDLYTKYPLKIKSLVVDYTLDTSLDTQISIMWNTKCSLWGSTGASQLAYFVDRPMFAQLVLGVLPRVTKKEYNLITNDFKNIKYLYKYNQGLEFYNSSKEELYEEFNEFYNQLDV